MEAWTTIRYLHAQGKPIRAIAKELGLARNTVRAALREEGQPRYERPKRPNPKLAPFAGEIAVMFFEQNLIGSRILRELRKLGYGGGKTALYEHLRALGAATPSSRTSERFETPPAQQAQFDWSTYTVPLGGSLVKVIVFCLTLCFSRRKFYYPSLDETQGSVFEALEAGLRYFAGAPKELLVDNPRALVSNASPLHFQWNPRFLGLCGHYAIKPVACQPGRPRTKGKVERPFFYLEQHFIKANAWPSFDAFARELARFAGEELDRTVHSTTGEAPLERFGQEKGLLTPLPGLPYVGSHEQMRKVSWDCLVSFLGSRYSVPWQYAGKHVWLRVRRGQALSVRSQQGEEIAAHRLAARKGATVIEQCHYEGLRQALPKTRTMLVQTFARLFPGQEAFCEGVLIQHKANAVAHLRAILALGEVYPQEALLCAFAQARQYNAYSHRFIRGLLEAQGQTQQTSASHLAFHPPSGRVVADLGVYQRLLEAGR